MEHIPLLFSVSFFFACSVSSILGAYIIYINPRENINRTFFALTISLSIWAFGFSIAISAPDMEACLFWRRISVIGWGSFFSILLHFFLLLTEKKSILKKWWTYLLLYLPAALVIYVFAISSDMAGMQFHLVNTPFGWVNIQVSNGWDWFYYVYYASFTVAGLGMVWRWGRASTAHQIKKQAHLILASFFVIFLLGTLTDIVSNSYLSATVPQIAPILILIPIVFIHYSIKRYGLMNPRYVSKDELILDETSRAKIYNYVSVSFFVGGFLSFVSLYLLYDNADLISVLLFSALLFFIGIIIQLVQRLKLGENHKDIITIIGVSLSIPIITLRFIEFGSITVWAFPFILIIASLIFNRRIVLVGIAISIILTQVDVWILVPHTTVIVDGVDHIVRIGLFIIAICIAFYVNKVYVLRLKEIAEQIGFQKLISEISSDFVNINQLNLDEKINHMLRKSGEFFQVDRTYAFLFDPERSTMTYTHEWCNEGIHPETGIMEKISVSAFPWWMDQITSNGIVHIPDIEKLPAEASQEKRQFARRNIQSLISLPIGDKESILGFLGFDSVKSKKKWRDDHMNLLKIIANILADALAKVDAEKEINYRAYYDHLTKLPNRFLFKDRLNQAINLGKQTGEMIGVMFLDLDSFKTVNDTMGHEGGDELITQVGQHLSQCVGKSDTVSRFGGDEFLVMANHISDRSHIVEIAEKIMELFKKPFMLKGQEFFITASAGIALYPEDGEDTETLIKNADIAMYNAKDRGKSQFVLCSQEMKDEVLTKMKLTNSLYRAQERNELILYYQPQVNLQTKEISGLEALIRWNHPELGMISPGVFIPLAEQTGLINSIGEWVLKTACRQNKVWQDMGFPPVRMAANLSVNQFRDPTLVEQVDKVLKETGLNPKYLELEVTENVAIKEASYIISVLGDLKELGVSISIDDFGTEHSSLSRLKILPADRIKIDMQFVRGIEENDKDKAILKAIIQLAGNLGLSVIAEGVETKTQLEFLCESMCDEVQGYYYYRPMPAEDVEAILKNS